MTITMTVTKKELKEGTKTVFQPIETTTTTITEEQYKHVINAKKFFSGWGKERHIKNYTKIGYIVTRILQTSPDKREKIEREFTFA